MDEVRIQEELWSSKMQNKVYNKNKMKVVEYYALCVCSGPAFHFALIKRQASPVLL